MFGGILDYLGGTPEAMGAGGLNRGQIIGNLMSTTGQNLRALGGAPGVGYTRGNFDQANEAAKMRALITQELQRRMQQQQQQKQGGGDPMGGIMSMLGPMASMMGGAGGMPPFAI